MKGAGSAAGRRASFVSGLEDDGCAVFISPSTGACNFCPLLCFCPILSPITMPAADCAIAIWARRRVCELLTADIEINTIN